MSTLRCWRFSVSAASPGGSLTPTCTCKAIPYGYDLRFAATGSKRLSGGPANRISLIVNEKRGITADTTARLGRYFGTSAQYWLNIQNRFDLDCIDWAAIERDVIPKQA